MATRFYMPSSGTPAASPAHGSLWDFGAPAWLPLVQTPTNTGLATVSQAETSTSAPLDLKCSGFISSDTLPAGSVSGTFSIVVMTNESNTGADGFLQVRIFVVSGDGSTERGDLYSGQTQTVVSATSSDPNFEFSVSRSTRILSGISLTSQTAQAGDRIAVELGGRVVNVTATSRNVAIRNHDLSAATDRALAVNGTEDAGGERSWIEFSQSLFAANIAVGIATETDAALSITSVTTLAVGQASEADTALAITVTSGTVVAVGLASEADTALAATSAVGAVVTVGIVEETDAALAVTVVQSGSPQTVDVGLASETDAAFAITSSVNIPVGIASEVDSALAITSTVGAVVAVGIATETDSTLSITVISPIAVGLAAETDSALSITVLVVYTTDTTNRVGGRVRGGFGVATWEPPVVDPTEAFIGPVVHDFEKAHAFVAPTVTNGRVVPFSPTITAAPRHRDRILVGGKDVSFFRGIPTPTPSYRLVQPFLYGAGSLTLPQVNPLFESLGTGDLSWLDTEKVVKVQRVDTTTNAVVAEDYCGFISAFSIDGDTLVCDLGGELTGRMALRHRQVPVFKGTVELGRLFYDAVRAVSLRAFTPRLGEITGIELTTFGGMNELDYANQLSALGTHLNGDQWTVGLNDDGKWGMWVKDRTTVDATIYFDDARIPASLNRDISEEPNRVYATAVHKDGHKINFRVYPRLRQGEPPQYPMDDNSSFGLGTTDADTDTGSGISSLTYHLVLAGFLTRANNDDATTYTADVVRAVKRLQDVAGLSETGIMNVATWRDLFDLSATGYSFAGATTLPAAWRSSVRQWNRTATGSISTRNPNYDPHKIVVDAQRDMGVGFDALQVREWARDEMGPEGNWVGTATCHFALVRGEHTPGAAVSQANVMSAREIRPGMNVWAPLFDGGTLFHVSGVEVPAGGRSPVLTLDTRARDTMKAWEVIQRNRDSRRDPARVWLNQYKSSNITKDGLGTWDKVGGIIDDRVSLHAGWNHIPVVAGQEGTIKKVRVETDPPTEFVASLSGREISDARMTHLVPNPLTEAGTERWETPWVRNVLEDRVHLESWGGYHQPCGYFPRRKYDDNDEATGPLTGVLEDAAGISYHTFAQPVLWLAIWVPSACTIRPGRIMWQQLEEGS